MEASGHEEKSQDTRGGIVLIPATYPCASGFTSQRKRHASFLCVARETPEHFSHWLPMGPQITRCRVVAYV